jgi:peptide/nickel transport system substrate-binding protein
VIDDRRFEIVTRRPFPNMPAMLARDTFFFVMPERMALTPPMQQIGEFVGSGPYRFAADEWQSGVQAVFTRSGSYIARDEPADFLSGGKRVQFDRVEWKVLPDPATAAAALQNGEVDWVQRPHPDLLPLLRKAPGVKVASADPFGATLMLLFNHLQAPFNNPALRRALLPAIDQSSFVAAALGDDPAIGRTGVGYFTSGLGMDSLVGMAALTGPRDLARSRQMVRDSGYHGEKIVILTATEVPEQNAICLVAAELFGKLGLNVDLITMDQGSLEKRRLNHDSTDKGGWSVVPLTYDGLSGADPSSHQTLRGNGVAGFFGWPTSTELETMRDQWFLTADLASQQAICRDMQRTAFEQVPYLPLGHWFAPTALRANLQGLVRAPFPIFWNINRV